jgi:hypothetical protein
MSPKSRGRPKGRGRPQQRRPSHGPETPRERHLADQLLNDASQLITETDALGVERWASDWLGVAWVRSPVEVRDAEQRLCTEVAGRVRNRPSRHGLAAVAALLRVAPESEQSLLRETVALLAAAQPLPGWHHTPTPEPVAAWRAVDVWGSEHALFVEFGGPAPHTLMALVHQVGGVLVGKLALLHTSVTERWPDYRGDDDPPMPIAEAPAADVLAELASALRGTDMTWPRQDDEDFLELRALAWRRCRDHLGPWPTPEPLDDARRTELLAAFEAEPEVKALGVAEDAVAYVSSLCLDYGEGYIPSGHLAWSPAHVANFLIDWLPRKAHLDADDRAALPGVLRAWVRFALLRRGIPEEWITPVARAVDEFLPAFTAAVDDASSWGPAKQFVAYLDKMGIDPTDQAAVQNAIDAYNAQLDADATPSGRGPRM